MMNRWCDSTLMYIVLLFLYLRSGSFTVGKIQHRSHPHPLDMVCLNGDGSRAFSVSADMAFLSKGLTSLSIYCSWRMEAIL